MEQKVNRRDAIKAAGAGLAAASIPLPTLSPAAGLARVDAISLVYDRLFQQMLDWQESFFKMVYSEVGDTYHLSIILDDKDKPWLQRPIMSFLEQWIQAFNSEEATKKIRECFRGVKLPPRLPCPEAPDYAANVYKAMERSHRDMVRGMQRFLLNNVEFVEEHPITKEVKAGTTVEDAFKKYYWLSVICGQINSLIERNQNDR